MTSPEQRFAIRLSNSLGARLARQRPDLADSYRSGLSYSDIVKKEDITGIYHVTRDIAKAAICCAMNILLEPEERERLGSLHRGENGRHSHKMGMGLYSLSEEELQSSRRRGGEKSGAQARDEGRAASHSPTRITALRARPALVRAARFPGRRKSRRRSAVCAQTRPIGTPAGAPSGGQTIVA